MQLNAVNERKCVQADYEFCYSLSKENMEPYFKLNLLEWDKNIFERKFNFTKSKILEYEGKRIGFYSYYLKKNYWYIEDIQLLQQYQGKGLGKYIFRKIEGAVKKSNVKTIRLRILEGNKAINIYKKYQFYVIKKDNSYILMEKKV